LNGPRLSGENLGPATTHGWRARWFHIIFHHERGASRRFDLLLMVAIVASVIVVVLDSVSGLHAR